MHYFSRNIGDYHKKAGRLNMLQHGAYTLLMDACYDRERFPTFDEAIEWCWASTAEEIAAVEFVLKKFFKVEDGLYVQGTIREEVQKYKENCLINKEIAIKREQAKRDKKARTVIYSCTNEHETPPNHKPITINHKPITNNQLKDIPPQAEESEKAITNQLVVEKKSRATRLPSDWIPSQEYFDELANIDEKLKPKFNIIAATFRDYWVSKSGNDATKTDWLATWRNWVRREAEKNAKSIGSNKSSFHERRADLTEAVTDYERATRF